MSSALQERRDSITKGDPVLLVIAMAGGVTKKKEATVKEVLRGAVRIEVTGEKTTRLVRLNMIEFPEPKMKETPVYREPIHRLQGIDLSDPMKSFVPPPAPASELPPAPEKQKTPFEVWLEMGSDLLNDQRLALELLNSEEAALDIEEKDITEQIELLKLMLADFPARRAAFPARRAEILQQMEQIQKRLGQ